MNEPVVMPQKKVKLNKDKLATADGIETKPVASRLYCRKCGQTKHHKNFKTSFDLWMDSNGMMSVCNDCICQVYDGFLASEKDQNKATLRLCRTFNWLYREETISKTNEQLADKRRVGHYALLYHGNLATWGSLAANHRESSGTKLDLKFVEPTSFNMSNPVDPNEVSQDVVDFWGEGYTSDNYRSFERTLAQFRKTHQIDTRTDLGLLKLIVLKEYQIDKTRIEGKDTTSLEKSYAELIKTAGLNRISDANSGKNMEAFSLFIKQIEEKSPAELYKDRKKFADYDGIDLYLHNYVRKPLKNFMGLSRDFTVDDGSDSFEFDEEDETSDIVSSLGGNDGDES